MRGALVGIDPISLAMTVVSFQYNPDSLSRTLQSQTTGDGGDRSEPLRLRGAPVETIKLEVELDATDALEASQEPEISNGLHTQLAALEMMLYPRSSLVLANTALLAAGTLEVLPPAAPLTVFIWGASRILPVKISEFSVTEEAFDGALNPIRARVGLGLRVLSYSDLPVTHPGYSMFLSHQVVKEALALVGSANSMARVGF